VRYDIEGYRSMGATLRIGQSDSATNNRATNAAADYQNWLGGRGSDVPLADASGAQLVLEAHTDHVRATPSAELAFWRLNGKRATLPKRVRAGDVIEFCGTRLKLVEASFQPREGKKALLERRLQILKASADPVLEVVKALTARTR
jgi:hypothetical protein